MPFPGTANSSLQYKNNESAFICMLSVIYFNSSDCLKKKKKVYYLFSVLAYIGILHMLETYM